MSSPLRRLGRWVLPLAAVLASGPSVKAGPITPADPAVPLTFDTAAGEAYSLVTQDPWTLLFDDRTFSSDDESALALLDGRRGGREGFVTTVRIAGEHGQRELDDVRRAIATAHVWSPVTFLRGMLRVQDWSPVVLSEDESGGRLVPVPVWSDDAPREPRQFSPRLRYHAPVGPHTTSLLPGRPGSGSRSGSGHDWTAEFSTDGISSLPERAQSIPAPPAAVLTLLGLAAWYARRTRRQ